MELLRCQYCLPTTWISTIWYQESGFEFCTITIVHRFHAGAVAYSRAHFGQGSGPILLNNIQCVGTERFLLECYWTAHNAHTCLHSEDAGVMCQGINKALHNAW